MHIAWIKPLSFYGLAKIQILQGKHMIIKIPIISFMALIIMAKSSTAAEAPLVSIPTHDNFFSSIKQHCGKAYVGRVTVDNASDERFSDKKLVMHVRRCTDRQLQVPFHVGDDASRTWIISKTGSGLSLKHDHRHNDGSNDKSTMYGGHTIDAGWNSVQSFPTDQYTKQLFVEQGIPQSVDNIWQMYIYPDKFTYRLIRQGREFRVDFDLTKPVNTPVTPWGYE
jgi:hypothetical protein